MSLDEKYIKVLNPKAFIDVSKEDFKAEYRGKLAFDLNDAWNWIKSNRGSKPNFKKSAK